MDAAHMGLGGDDSWSRSVHAQHLLRPGGEPWDFALALRPLAEGDDADAAYRSALVAPALRAAAERAAADSA
jgi:hypothetical protein